MEEKIKELISKYDQELVSLDNKYNELQMKQNQSKRKSTRVTEEIRWLLAYKTGIEIVIKDLKKIE